jgi:hypothetical protein
MKSSRLSSALMVVVTILSCTGVRAQPSVSLPPPGAFIYSVEGLALTGTAAVTLPDITVVFGNNLTYQDDIQITLQGAKPLAPAVTPGLVTCEGASNAVGYVSLAPGGWNFRVTDVGGITIGKACIFKGLPVVATSLVGSIRQLTYQASRGLTSPTVIIDGPVTSATFVEARSQFGISVQQPLNGVINVLDDRLSFFYVETVLPGSGSTNTSWADTLNFTVTADGSGAAFTGPTVTATRSVVTIVGDFSWVDGKDDGKSCEPAEFLAPNVQGLDAWYTVGARSSCAQLELVNITPAVTTAAKGFLFVPGTVALDPTNWAATVQWEYHLTSDTSKEATGTLFWDPGAWTINGAQVYIQYMPWGPGIAHLIYAANRGAGSPKVSADVTVNGSTFVCPLGTLSPMSVTVLSAGIDSCVAAKGITDGRASILLTFVAPSSMIEVYSAYNVGGSDVGTVINTSNGRAPFYGTGKNFTYTPEP